MPDVGIRRSTSTGSTFCWCAQYCGGGRGRIKYNHLSLQLDPSRGERPAQNQRRLVTRHSSSEDVQLRRKRLLRDIFNNKVDLSTVQRVNVVCKLFLREKSNEKQKMLSQRFGWVWLRSRLIILIGSMKPGIKVRGKKAKIQGTV